MSTFQSGLENTVLNPGAYVARFARSCDDMRRCQQLGYRCFVKDVGALATVVGIKTDMFDTQCDYIMVEDRTGLLLCSYRLMSIRSGSAINSSYSAQYYDLKRLLDYSAPMLEMGRFCVDPAVCDPDVLRVAWGMLAVIVDARSVGLLFGCSSFVGTDAGKYRQAFELLAQRHQAPGVWHPDIKAPQVIRFETKTKLVKNPTILNYSLAMAQVPALLKTYLAMGGWVSDHAVVDTAMNTLHVFTGVEIANIPPARAKALRAVAAWT
jgi:putative hemolysin